MSNQIDAKLIEEEWEIAEYNPGITTEQWLALLKNSEIFDSKSLAIMKRIKDCGGMASCKQLSAIYGETYHFYRTHSVSLALRVAKETHCQIYKDDKGTWPFQILYLGRRAHKNEVGNYIWKLRDELSQALDLIDLSNVPLFSKTEVDTTLSAEHAWGPIDYNPGITVEQWTKLLVDSDICNENSKKVLKRMKDCGGVATCKQLHRIYGESSWQFYLSNSSSLAQRVASKTNCLLYPDKSRKNGYKLWPVLYWGRDIENNEDGTFEWKLRDEISSALEQVDFSNISLYADYPPNEELLKISPEMSISDIEKAARNYSKLQPIQQQITTAQYQRSSWVKKYAKIRANGRCQLCGKKAPFIGSDGDPYLEVHHIKWLARGGADTPENTVALCPNCHRKMHVLYEQTEVQDAVKYLTAIVNNTEKKI